jgi:amino acid adenylation domain-containing protein
VNAPKGTLTAELRSQITDHKAELLAFLRDQASSASPAPPPIPRRVSKEPAPLSFAQERLWFLEQLDPGTTVYNICRASRLTGKLNTAALEASLTEILRRHEILRSQIRIVDGRPVQITVAMSRFEVPVTDLRSLTETERDAEVRDRIKAEAQRPFEFSAGLFLRVVLLQTSDEQHILVLTTHHIVSDAWSMGILTKEIWILYDAYANGRPVSLAELPVQYADYAAWQREWLQGDVLESQLSYWKERLNELLVLNLPTDHPRPAKQSFRGARQPITLSESLTAAVNELSRREGVTQFMTLLAALQLLLYRYSGQEDVVVGSPIANRNHAEVEGLIGFFVNTLVLRTDCSGNPTFREFLLRVRDVCLRAYAHQDLPFEKLVQELHPERDLSRNPLFQVMFALQNATRPLAEVSGLSFERMEIETRVSQFDLALFLREREGKLIGFFEYNTGLFDRSTIARMIGHFQKLLKGIVADPEQPIATLPLLTKAERHQLLVEWNDTAADYPKDSCIYELFEAQVERTPEIIAVQFEGKQLTYRELNNQANQLAHCLRQLGVGPENLVGICVERSLEIVIGLLAILKAGGAYVPLDPSYPKERLAFMMEDSQVSVLLTSERIIGGFKTEDAILDPQIRMIYLDRDREKIAQQSERNPDKGAAARNLAYVIYTSGSTGQPKGVQIEHRSVINCLYSMRQQIGLAEKDVMLAVTTISFDVAALENFLPLTTGAKLVLASRDEALDGRQLLDRLTEYGTTAMQATPSAWKLLLDVGWRSGPDFKILCGGEVLSRELADKLLEDDATLWNLYGPTEATIWSTIAKMERDGRRVLIGRPIANTQIYILDPHLQPVPVGVYGELYIGGDGLARGYSNRPELTGEKFVDNPFSSQPEARLYRTGDRVRYRADGNIEFIGRIDNQVKIRGYRIEPGEIEAVLTKHPTVKDCVVVICEHESGTEKSLVGYVVPMEHSVFSVTELRRYLKEKLPEYMIPSAFVMLETLPLTPNGKIDLQKLPRPDGARSQFTQEFVAPHREIEELIAQAWREVLEIENIGVHDNFFELGGHSLSAIQIISRLRDVFNREIPLRILFETPTVTSLAEKIERVIREERGFEFPPILPVPRSGLLPLSMSQEQLWNLDNRIPGTHFFNMPYVYRLGGDLNMAALEKALRKVISRHEALRTVFAEVDGHPVQVIKEVPDFQLPVVDLRGLKANDLRKRSASLILEERVMPFDLAKGPLFRTKVLRLTDHGCLLLVTMHHIISDQASMRVFRSELATLYELFSKGKPSPLSDVPIQFADFAAWERRSLDSEFMKDQLAYWQTQLAGLSKRIEFTSRDKISSQSSFRTSSLPIKLDESLFRDLKAFAHKKSCTPFMILLTTVNILLHVWTGQKDIRIATLVANRHHRETEAIIGHFINTLVLRAAVFPEMTFNQLLKQSRDLTLAAYAHEEFPFDQLAAVLEEQWNIDRASLFQVMLLYGNLVSYLAKSPGPGFAPLDIMQAGIDSEMTLTECDLIFNLREASTKVTGVLTYKTQIFDHKHISDMIRSFEHILRYIIAHEERTLEDFFREPCYGTLVLP